VGTVVEIKKLLTLFVTVLCLQMSGQNLVPNPSFESYGNLPCSWITNENTFNNALDEWYMPTDGSTDVFSTLVATSCYSHCLSTNGSSSGQQMPRTGDIMTAILTWGAGCGSTPNFREYIAVQLTSPLEVGSTYYAELYVSFADFSEVSTNNIGMYFSEDMVYEPSLCLELGLTPQVNETEIISDSEGWTKVSGTFVATEPYEYLVIGNFYDNPSTATLVNPNSNQINARYFVDDVLVQNACLSASSDTTICEGGTAELVASGEGIVGWASENSPDDLVSTDSTLTVSLTQTETFLVYADCDTLSVTVSVSDGPSIDLGEDVSLCPGEIITLDATLAGATYLWQDNSVGPEFTVTLPGEYWVEVTNDCGTFADTINVTSGLPPEVDLGNDTTLCLGASLLLDATLPNATYLWQNNSTDATFMVTQTGIYSVDVTVGGCTGSGDIVVTFTDEPAFIQETDTTLCQGQSIFFNDQTLTETGIYNSTGQGGLCDTLYILDLEVTSAPTLFTDVVICPGEEFTFAGEVLTMPGTYTQITTNPFGCDSITTVDLSFASPIEDFILEGEESCAGQTVTLLNTVESADITWSTGSTDQSVVVPAPGEYFATVVDEFGCAYTQTITLDEIDIDFVQVDVVSISDFNGFEVSCFDGANGSIEVNALNGTPPYTYDWNNGMEGNSLSGLGSGLYIVSVTDADGCTGSAPFSFEAPDELFFELSVDNPICRNETNGRVEVVNTFGGLTPYTYNLDNSDFQEEQEFVDLGPGPHNLSILDGNGCVTDFQFDLVNPPLFMVQASDSRTLEEGESADIEVMTDLEEIASILWVPSEGLSCFDCLTPTAQPAESTLYEVIITDENGCRVSDFIRIDIAPFLEVYIPNSFTPNEDGINDIFKPVLSFPPESYKLRVYNRWGNLVFESSEPGLGWNGSTNQDEFYGQNTVYQYHLTVGYANIDLKEYRGTITVVR
jgi:gliding motility-associated-like protein